MAFRSLKKLAGLRQSQNLPEFLCVGTQKGGTTSLQKLLEQHPGVYLPPCKEVQYFSLNAEQPASWYANHYINAQKGQLLGDITPFYMFHPQAAKRIKKLLPHVRIIVLLRDPVERTLSQIFHAQRHGFEKLNVKDALAAEGKRLASGNSFSFQKHSYLARSLYIEQMDRYEKYFPKKNMLILKSEELFNAPEKPWEQIQSFLKLKIISLPKRMPVANAGKGESVQVDDTIRNQLRNELLTTVLAVRKRYGIDWGWG